MTTWRDDYRSWGGTLKAPHLVAQPFRRSEAVDSLTAFDDLSVLGFGCGRSYGDVALNPSAGLIDCRALNRFLAFDSETGLLSCEAGVRLADILAVICRPEPDGSGWMLPVTPGTRFVTVAGAIANDVHGKNHHEAGTFGRHVISFELLRGDGTRLTCSADENAEMFAATIGGLGLTGLILSATLKMRRVAGLTVEAEDIRFDSLQDFFELAAESDSTWDYTAAWIDCLASGAALGRGIYSRARHDLSGLSIERYYHFVCKADAPTFALMRELGIGDAMRWRPTSMGYFTHGKLYSWGDPVSLLRFPHLSLVEKLRYGLLMFISTKLNSWPALEHVSAKTWIETWCGASVYAKLWKPLFDLKFYEYADNVSASWIWTRIRRIGRSRKSLLQEELGYIDGGSETLVKALVAAICAKGGDVRLGEPAQQVLTENGRVTGVRTAKGIYPADAVISTVPTPYVAPLVPDLPPASLASYEAIENIGVACVLLKLKKSVTPHFWVNVIDPQMPIPGIIEFSNLRPTGTGETVVYVPYYMPSTNPLWGRPDETFVSEAMACISRINPAIGPGDLVASQVSRLKHAQPVCPPDFAAMIPPVQTPIAGLQIADTCFYYPEDRGIAESVRLGQDMALAAVGAR